MDAQDAKIFLTNLTAMGISMTSLEMTLKITLLVVSIAYTVQRMLELKNKKKQQ